MLCKKTVKNQLTLPKKIVDEFMGINYFDAQVEGNSIVLKPVEIKEKETSLYKIRSKIKTAGISETDVSAAIEWVRTNAKK